LAKLGVEKRLAELGAVEGSTVIIGPEDNAVVFDWVPSVEHEAQVEPVDGQAQEPESAVPIAGDENTGRS
jgi:GTP-binding protein